MQNLIWMRFLGIMVSNMLQQARKKRKKKVKGSIP